MNREKFNDAKKIESKIKELGRIKDLLQNSQSLSIDDMFLDKQSRSLCITPIISGIISEVVKLEEQFNKL